MSQPNFAMQKILPDNPKKEASLGNSAIYGNWAVISSNYPFSAGAVHVYYYENGNWVEKQKLEIQGNSDESFGYSIAIHGNWIIVGANFENSLTGSAYLFHLEEGRWVKKQRITPKDPETGSWFGQSVALSRKWAIIGASGQDPNGKVYLFYKKDGKWNQKQVIQAESSNMIANFGGSVGISGDWVIVGANGSAFLFYRKDEIWQQKQEIQAKIKAYGDNFGQSVAICGNNLIVGAPGDNTGGKDSGSAYLFQKNDGDAWEEIGKVQANDKKASDFFGQKVAISNDLAIVGSPKKDMWSGSAYLFQKKNGIWNQLEKLEATDTKSGDSFGISVSISRNRAIIGASGSDSQGTDTGCAYVIDFKWPEQTLTPAVIVFRHADDVNDDEKDKNGIPVNWDFGKNRKGWDYHLPNGENIHLHHTRLKPRSETHGWNDADTIGDHLNEWMKKNNYCPVGRVITQQPFGNSIGGGTTPNPFNTVFPAINQNPCEPVEVIFYGNGQDIDSLEKLVTAIEEDPEGILFNTKNYSTLICMTRQDMWNTKKQKDMEKDNEEVKPEAGSLLCTLTKKEDNEKIKYEPLKAYNFYVFMDTIDGHKFEVLKKYTLDDIRKA